MTSLLKAIRYSAGTFIVVMSYHQPLSTTEVAAEQNDRQPAKSLELPQRLEKLHDWVREHKELILSGSLRFPVEADEAKGALSPEELFTRVQEPGMIRSLDAIQETLLAQHISQINKNRALQKGEREKIRAEGKVPTNNDDDLAPYQLAFCIGREGFINQYREASGRIRVILEGGKFHHQYLNHLIKVIQERLFLMNAPEEMIVHYSQHRHLIVIRSMWDLETIYKNMRALS